MNLWQQIRATLHKPRFLAFLIHFGISITLISIVFLVVYWIWFPHALAAASGGFEGLFIVAGVDVTLGPLLTLVVYDTINKRWPVLQRDLAIIATLQLASLAAGVAVVHHARPLAVVHLYNSFHVVRQQDFEAFKVDWHTLEKLPGNYPKIVYVVSEKNEIAFMAKQILDGLNKKTPQYLRVDLYQAIPKDQKLLKRILKQPQSGNPIGCMLQNIESVYTSGHICFNVENAIFTNFIADKPLVYIEPGPQP